MSTEVKPSDDTVLLPPEEARQLLENFPRGVISLDLETTGLSPLTDSIIEISAIKVLPSSEGPYLEVFDQLINPETPIPELTTQIHGITDTMVVNSPNLKEALPRFLEFVEDLPLIAHNALFDLGFLVFQIHQQGLTMPLSEIYCSCRLSRMTFKNFQGHGLAQASQNLDITLENHHRALDDSLAALRIYAKALSEEGIDSQAQLNGSLLFELKDFEKNKDFSIPAHLTEIKEKLPHQTPIMIKYKGGSYGKDFRPIRPISLLPMPSGNILYAHCLHSDLYKSFALKKINSVRDMTNEEYKKFLGEQSK